VELVADRGAEEEGHPVEQVGGDGHLVEGLAVVAERQVGRGQRQGQAEERLGDVGHLGGRAAQEFAAGRRVVEQVADLGAGAGGAVPGPGRGQVAAVAGDRGPVGQAGRARLEGDLGDAADGGQGLAAEAEGADPEQVLGAVELAGGVAGEGQRQVLGGDAAAVVHDADELGAAALDLEVDAGTAGVEGVLQQLLDHAGGPLDDLAGGDLGDHGGRQLPDAGHRPVLVGGRKRARPGAVRWPRG
jgi:hypothetical protein